MNYTQMIDGTYRAKEEKIYFSKLEPLFFYLFFAAAVYFVYLKTDLALPFFLILLGLSWFSKRNYFWIAFFFIILDCPAWFFTPTLTSNLPLIRVLPGVSLTPIDCFTVLMTVKAFFQPRSLDSKLAFKTPLTVLSAYFIFSFFWGVVFHSESLDAAISYVRPVTYFFWYIFFRVFIQSEEKVFRFLKLIFPIVFFIIFAQFYFLLTGNEFTSFFDPYLRVEIATNSLTNELRPVVGGTELVFLSYIGGLLFIKHKAKAINKLYIYLIIITAFLSIFISATRVLFVLFTSIFIGVFSKTIKDAIRLTAIILLIFLLMFALIKFGALSEEYLKDSAWGRVSQVFMFFEGKSGRIDTFSTRLEQLEVLKDKISQSVIFGYGFSTVSKIYYNNNWGVVNTLLVLGLVGLLSYVLLFMSYFKMIISALRRIKRENAYRESVRVLVVGFTAMLGAYCFTWDFFTPFYDYKIAFVMIFFGISELFCTKAQEKWQI